MTVAIRLDEVTLATVREYAPEIFREFDADKTYIFGIKHKEVVVPYQKSYPSFADEPWPRYRNVTLDVPTNWFERFKDKHWSCRLRRLWPVRTRQAMYAVPDYCPGLAHLTIITEPHTLPDGKIMKMGIGVSDDGQCSALAVRLVA